jgi:Outer membrane protein beta-barrel domain
MKRLFFILFFISSLSNAQFFRRNMFAKNPIINLENFDKHRIHYGFYLGLNTYDFKIDKKFDYKDIYVERNAGYEIGLIANLRLSNYFDLRFEPGLFSNQRDLRFPNFDRERDQLREVKSTYIRFPLLLKFSAKRLGNVKPFLLGGFSYDLNISSNGDSPDDNSQGRFRIKRNTFSYELGLGIDLYNEYFKFSPSIRGVFGIQNEIVPDNNPNSLWTGNIDNLATRGIFLNFSFH